MVGQQKSKFKQAKLFKKKKTTFYGSKVLKQICSVPESKIDTFGIIKKLKVFKRSLGKTEDKKDR